MQTIAARGLTTPLWTHQYACVQKMLLQETRMYEQKQNLGLLSSDIGSGKTLIALALVGASRQVRPDFRPVLLQATPLPVCLANMVHAYAQPDFRSLCLERHRGPLFHFERREATVLDSNLMVVPFHLFKQWKTEVQRRTSLRCAFVGTDPIDAAVFGQHDLVLCNSNKYDAVARYSQQENLRWQRVLYDEAHAIDLPQCRPIDSMYYWAITTSFNALHRIRNRGFLRQLLASLSVEQLRSIMVATARDELDRQALQFVPYTRMVIECKASADKMILNQCYPMSRLADLIQEDQDVRAHEYLVNQLRFKDKANNGHPLAKAVKTMNLLELQMLNVALDLRTLPSTKRQRLMRMGREIYRHGVCTHCTAPLPVANKASRIGPAQNAVRADADMAGTIQESPQGTTRVCFLSPCCQLPYCQACTQRVPLCPWCVRKRTSGPGTPWIQGHTDHGREFVALHRMDGSSLGSSCISSSRWTPAEPVVMQTVTRDMRRRQQLSATPLDSHTNEFVTRECAFISAGELDKFEACRRILAHHRDERALIYVDSAPTALRLFGVLSELGLTYAEVKGSPHAIDKRIRELESHAFQALVLSGEHLCYGLNVQGSDLIVSFKELDAPMRSQLVGRRNRPHCDAHQSLLLYELKTIGRISVLDFRDED